MKKARSNKISKHARDLLYLNMILAEEYMTAPTLAKLLAISERQLSYWDSKGLKMGEKHMQDHLWKRYSVFDIFGFAVVTMLKRQGVALDKCEPLITYLRTEIIEQYEIQNFILGKYIYLTFAEDKLDLIYSNKEISKYEKNLFTIPTSPVIPLHFTMKWALESAQKENLTIKFVRNKRNTGDKAVFTIKDNRLGTMTIDLESHE